VIASPLQTESRQKRIPNHRSIVNTDNPDAAPVTLSPKFPESIQREAETD
jgi:hypothetical protein